ncbi:MAG: sensor histidine kinase [Gemmatimonadales bacterium]|nr:MAG: sensor histidine kinase [Gemmatimonadales bacterium]
MLVDNLAWILVLVLAGVVVWLLRSRRAPENPYPEALRRLAREVAGGEVEVGGSREDPEEVESLRRALEEGWVSKPQTEEGATETVDTEEELQGDPMQVALEGVLGYLERTVLPALEEARSLPEPGPALQDAVDALEDLAFYASSREEEPSSRENLAQLVQVVTREYTLETGIPLRVRGPDRPIHFHTRPEAFKDSIFLLLANAGRWGEGKTVDLTLAAEDGRVRVKVRDQGPGFSSEALYRAFRPFWSSERDALGLGLTHARHLVRGMGGDLTLGNREEGGGEVVLDLPQGPSSSE